MQKTAWQITKKVLSAICWAILLFLIVVASWLAIDKHVRKSAVPSFMGYATLVIVSPSMSGTIEVDDLIVIRKCDEYKIGDVITYMKEGDEYSTTHRIVFYDENGDYLTKGDANNSRDLDPVYKNEVLGKVVLTIPHYAKFSRWLTKEGGWLYVGSAILIFILGGIILKSENNEEAVALEGENDSLSSSDKTSNDIKSENNAGGVEGLPESTSQPNSEKPANPLPQDSNKPSEENK